MSYNSLQASLLGNWMQQDNAASTVIVDSSGHSLNGTLINAGNTSAITTSGPNAYLPAGFTYDATNDYCDLTSDASLLPSSGVARTYEAWVKCRATGYNYLFAFGSPRPAITLTFVGNRPIIYLGTSNYQYFNTSASTTLLDGNWHHIIAVITGTAQFDIDNCKLYLDGSSVTPSGGPSHAAAPETFSYLRSPVGNSYNVAATSGIAVHPTALSSTQVSERFAGPELENTSLPTLTIDSTSFSGSVGSWSLPSPFASGSNGTPTYQWELRDADDDSVVASGSTSTISGSGSYSGDYYLWVRASNDGGYDPAEDSVSATQTVSGGPTPLNASLAATLDGVTASASVISPISAGVTAQLDGVTASSAAVSDISAGVTTQLDGVIAASTAVSPIAAGVTAQLDGVMVASTIGVDSGNAAALTATLDGVTASAATVSTISAGVTATLDGATAISAAIALVSSTVTAQLDGVSVTASASGPTGNAAALTAQLDGVTASSAVTSSISAGLTAQLVGVTAVSAALSLIAAGVTSTLDGVSVVATIGDVVGFKPWFSQANVMVGL